jgi:hypothetical protein
MSAVKYGYIGSGDTSDLDFVALDYVKQLMMFFNSLIKYKDINK